MPLRIKLALSLVAALVTVAGFFFQNYLDPTGPKYVILFLGAFMVVSMWVFPEVTRKEPPRRDRKP